MLPKNRPPTLPGEVLLEEFLKPMEMTQTQLAEKLEVFPTVVNGIVNGRRAVSPEMAVKLGRVFKVSSQFWMNLQTNVDLWKAEQAYAKRA